MLPRSTLAATALRPGWCAARYPRISVGRRLQSVSDSYPRRGSIINQEAPSEIDFSEKLKRCTAYTTLDLALHLRGVEILASRNGGRNALDVLKNLEDRDGHIMVVKGIRCLQAYCDCISLLSVQEAEKVIAVDDAGSIVHDWVRQPHVRGEIESNHKDNEVLLSLVTYILVGAGQTPTIETWMKRHEKIAPFHPSEKQTIYQKYRWMGYMKAALVQAIIAWHPRGLADFGYDYFSRKFEESWPHVKEPGNLNNFTYRLSWLYTKMSLERGYIGKRYPASSKSFERCANHLIAYNRFCDPSTQTFTTGLMALGHPNCPSADPFLAFCQEVHRDQDHPLRSRRSRRSRQSGGPRGMITKHAQFFCVLGDKASNLLKMQGRHDDGAFILRVIYGIWGPNGEHFESTGLYPERCEKWKQLNQAIMETRHPKFYIPHKFRAVDD